MTCVVGYNIASGLFSGNCELGCVEYMERAVSDSSFNFSNLFGSSGSACRTESGDSNAVFGEALSNVRTELVCLAVLSEGEEILIELGPCVCRICESGVRSSLKHIYVVADGVANLTLTEELFASGRSAGGVCVLTDDNAAVSDESFCCSGFLIDIEPRVGVVYFHNNVRNDGLNAEEECCITGNNFSVVLSADVTDFSVAVFVKVFGSGFGGDCAA